MIALSDLPELVRDYENGALLWRDAYLSLLHLLTDHDVDELTAALSSELANRFIDNLQTEFSDERWDEDGLWIDSAGGDPPNRPQIVARIRSWLRKREVHKQPKPE